MTTILGIDPGETGAIGMVCPSVEVWDMPATPHDLATLMRTFDPSTTRVYVESVHSMPRHCTLKFAGFSQIQGAKNARFSLYDPRRAFEVEDLQWGYGARRRPRAAHWRNDRSRRHH